MGRTLPRLRRNVYRDRYASSDAYEPIAKDSVPANTTWKPVRGHTAKRRVHVYFSAPIGSYKLIRDSHTGETLYFRRRDWPEEKSLADAIDPEPVPPHKGPTRVGGFAWFVDIDGSWFLVEIIDRSKYPTRVTIRSKTGWDEDRKRPWLYGELLEFSPRGRLFGGRLRHLKERKP